MNRIEREVYAELEAAARAAVLLLEQLGSTRSALKGNEYIIGPRLSRALESVAVIHTREALDAQRQQSRKGEIPLP